MQKITVLITCYQEGQLLRRAFASLTTQSDRDFEIVIVNDASPDGTTNSICLELESHKMVRVLWHSKNGGLSAARNTGYQAMRGDICIPLDADDTLPPRAVENIRNAFRQVPEADFVFGNYVKRDVHNGTDELVDCSDLCLSDGFLDPRQLDRKWILLGTSPCRRSAWQRIGGYSESFSHDGQDVDFLMRLISGGTRGWYVGQTIYEWNRSSMGMNSSVSPEVWMHVKVANIPFYDMLGKGIEARRRFMWNLIRLGDFVSVQRIARELVRLRCLSSSIVVAATLPPNMTRLLYRVRQDIRRFFGATFAS